jgi:hypothetical protein
MAFRVADLSHTGKFDAVLRRPFIEMNPLPSAPDMSELYKEFLRTAS